MSYCCPPCPMPTLDVVVCGNRYSTGSTALASTPIASRIVNKAYQLQLLLPHGQSQRTVKSSRHRQSFESVDAPPCGFGASSWATGASAGHHHQITNCAIEYTVPARPFELNRRPGCQWVPECKASFIRIYESAASYVHAASVLCPIVPPTYINRRNKARMLPRSTSRPGYHANKISHFSIPPKPQGIQSSVVTSWLVSLQHLVGNKSKHPKLSPASKFGHASSHIVHDMQVVEIRLRMHAGGQGSV
jgi:hypothetical protein